MKSANAERAAANQDAVDYMVDWLVSESEAGRLRGRCVIGRREYLWLSGQDSPEKLRERLAAVPGLFLRGQRGMYRLDRSWFWPGGDLPEVFLDVPDLFPADVPEVLPLERLLRSLPDVTEAAVPVWLEVDRRHASFRDSLDAE
jgi:hypothetical protein